MPFSFFTGVDAEDFLLGNVFSIIAVISCVKLLHTLLQDFLIHTSEKARAKCKEMKDIAIEKVRSNERDSMMRSR